MNEKNKRPLALILGASGSIGYACAEKLAKKNYDLILVHRDSKSALEQVNSKFKKLNLFGITVFSVNVNAVDEDGMKKVLDLMYQNGVGVVDVFIHAIADANIGNDQELERERYIHTINSMSISFSGWANQLRKKSLIKAGASVIGFTSEGSNKVLNHYAAAGVAKASLESLCKYMAIDYAKDGIRVNLINAGIINSKAVRQMPDSDAFLENALKRNPSGRLTTPEDIAKVAGFLASEDALWITGEVIRVDGGEQLIAL